MSPNHGNPTCPNFCGNATNKKIFQVSKTRGQGFSHLYLYSLRADVSENMNLSLKYIGNILVKL
jgi:hypothetical protein